MSKWITKIFNLIRPLKVNQLRNLINQISFLLILFHTSVIGLYMHFSLSANIWYICWLIIMQILNKRQKKRIKKRVMSTTYRCWLAFTKPPVTTIKSKGIAKFIFIAKITTCKIYFALIPYIFSIRFSKDIAHRQ